MTLTSRDEASETLDALLDYFGGDSAKMMIFLGSYFAGVRGVSVPSAGGAAEPTAEDAAEYDNELAQEMMDLQAQRRKAQNMAVQKRISSVDGSGRRLSQMEQQQVILESALEIAEQEEQEDQVLEEEVAVDEDDDDDAEPEYRYLPYVPLPKDEVDCAVAEYVNMNKLDILITRKFTKNEKKKKKSKKAMKRVYKLGPQAYVVRFVHQILIARQDDHKDASWEEFGQILEVYYESNREE